MAIYDALLIFSTPLLIEIMGLGWAIKAIFHDTAGIRSSMKGPLSFNRANQIINTLVLQYYSSLKTCF
jgi:hypothetical protein